MYTRRIQPGDLTRESMAVMAWFDLLVILPTLQAELVHVSLVHSRSTSKRRYLTEVHTCSTTCSIRSDIARAG